MSQDIFQWVPDGMDVGGWMREEQTQVTEQDIQRVQMQSGQAQQIFVQIQKDKIYRNQLADFLTFLLQNIKNEKIINWIYNVFFKVKHPKDDIVFVRKSINTIVVVWFFVPFYLEEVKQFQLQEFFEKIYDFKSKLSLTHYISYLKKLSQNYHDNVPIDKKTFLEFVENVVVEFELVEKSKLTKEKHPQFQKMLEKEIYWTV